MPTDLPISQLPPVTSTIDSDLITIVRAGDPEKNKRITDVNFQSVNSVFGRKKVVVATSGDYNSTQVTNSSGVAGDDVTDALNTLDAESGVSSFEARTGVVIATLNDYDASLINNDSTVDGATVKEALESAAASGALPQTKALYVSKAGNDSNSGLSIDTPKLNINAATALVDTPSLLNPWVIYVTGGYTSTQDVTVPDYTTIIGLGVQIQGNWTLGNESSVVIDNALTVGFSARVTFTKASAGPAYVKMNAVFGSGTNSTVFLVSSGTLFAEVDNLDATSSGCKGWAISSSGKLHLTTRRFDETVASTVTGSAELFWNVQDINDLQEYRIETSNTPIVLNAGGNTVTVGAGPTGKTAIDTFTRATTERDTQAGTIPGLGDVTIIAVFPIVIGTYIATFIQAGDSASHSTTMFYVNSDSDFTQIDLDQVGDVSFTLQSDGASGLELLLSNANASAVNAGSWTLLRYV